MYKTQKELIVWEEEIITTKKTFVQKGRLENFYTVFSAGRQLLYRGFGIRIKGGGTEKICGA